MLKKILLFCPTLKHKSALVMVVVTWAMVPPCVGGSGVQEQVKFFY
jgi:hypothetical protein